MGRDLLGRGLARRRPGKDLLVEGQGALQIILGLHQASQVHQDGMRLRVRRARALLGVGRGLSQHRLRSVQVALALQHHSDVGGRLVGVQVEDARVEGAEARRRGQHALVLQASERPVLPLAAALDAIKRKRLGIDEPDPGDAKKTRDRTEDEIVGELDELDDADSLALSKPPSESGSRVSRASVASTVTSVMEEIDATALRKNLGQYFRSTMVHITNATDVKLHLKTRKIVMESEYREERHFTNKMPPRSLEPSKTKN